MAQKRYLDAFRAIGFAGTLAALALVLPGSSALAAPVAVLKAQAGQRLGADSGDRSAAHVLRSGREVLEWAVPELAGGPYRIEMTVRTGNHDSNPLNCVRRYACRALAADGRETAAIRFASIPERSPARVPGKWPQWIGDIAGIAPMVLSSGMRLQADCSGVPYAEVREVRILRARDEDLIATTLGCQRPGKLFRLGEAMPLQWTVRSFLPDPVSLVGKLKLESPYGDVLAEQELAVEVPAGGKVVVTGVFTATLRGPHVAVISFRRGSFEYHAEVAVDVVSVPPMTRLSEASPFGVHPAGRMEMFDCGFKWVRLWDSGDVWNRHERQGKGKFDFSRTEAKVDRLRGQGMQILATLAYTPTWASTRPEVSHYTGGGAPYPPKDIQDWRDYCREYMTHFRGRIGHFEVWNEPNAGFFKGTAEEYIELLRAAYEVARQVDPAIRIVGGSGTGDFLPWTESLLKGGAEQYMDILSFHAYTTPESPEDANLPGRLQSLRRLTRQYGVPNMPLWNTEVGYWSDRRNGARPATAAELLAKAPADLRPNWRSGWPFRPIPEDEAAAYTVRHYLLNVAGGVQRVFWYSSITSGLPLLCEGGGVRYSCLAVANAAERLDGFTFARRIDLGLSRLYLQVWQRDGQTLGVLWCADRGSRDVEFAVAGAVPSVYDLWGNPREIEATAGVAVLEAAAAPLFIQAPEAFLAAARLGTRQLVIPVRDCRVVREVNAERPVKEHTSPAHHGARRVFGLPDAGDTLGWRLGAIRPGFYSLFVELRSGTAGRPYAALGSYRVTVVSDEGSAERLDLEGVEEEDLRAVALVSPEGAGRAYGFARAQEAVWLQPGSEVHVESLRGWGFVGNLMLRDASGTVRVRALPGLDVAPRLDGDLSEVAGLRAFDLRRRRQVVIGVADPFASTSTDDAWEGPEDLSARWWCALAPTGLYVAVNVVDSGKGRKSQIVWHGSSQNFQDPSAYGRFRMP